MSSDHLLFGGCFGMRFESLSQARPAVGEISWSLATNCLVTDWKGRYLRTGTSPTVGVLRPPADKCGSR
jgi:hypothetical protein